MARDSVSGELWHIVSDEPTSLQTFREYSERFDIEEEFLDEKSNGFQLEKSLIRSPMAVSRLCLVMAITTLFLTVQGVTTFHNNMAHPDTTQITIPKLEQPIRGCAMLLRDSVGAR